MPLYHFEHKETGDILSTICTYDEACAIEAEGTYYFLPCAPMITRSQGSIVSKVDDNFNDVLKHIKSSHKGATVETK